MRPTCIERAGVQQDALDPLLLYLSLSKMVLRHSSKARTAFSLFCECAVCNYRYSVYGSANINGLPGSTTFSPLRSLVVDRDPNPGPRNVGRVVGVAWIAEGTRHADAAAIAGIRPFAEARPWAIGCASHTQPVSSQVFKG
jgi:hypothetical protein